MVGKGYNNFMSKKAFHPASHANQRRIQEAEAKEQAKRKHDEETMAQYQKEQELFQQKSLVSRESKDKLSLSFMYDAPPSTSQKGSNNNEEEDTKLDLKWKLEKQIKSPSSPSGVKVKKSPLDDSDSDDEPKIVLKWKREEPKAKKATQPQNQEPDLKRVKKEH